jgi:hypothetical protein
MVKMTPKLCLAPKSANKGSSPMQLDTTRQIRDITPSREITDVVKQLNDLLLAGWKLIGFYVEAECTAVGNFGKPHYVIAWQSSEAPPDERLQGQEQHFADVLRKQLAEAGIDWADQKSLVSAIAQGESSAVALSFLIMTQIADLKK